MRYFTFYSFSAFFFFSVSCAREITRISSLKQVDLSGRWNDTDARLVAESLSDDIITSSWLNNFFRENKRKPVVIVGLIRNKSHEHIESEPFTKEVEKSLIGSQRAKIVSGGKMREELRAERADQQSNASLSTMKKFGLETGSDYILQGNINSIVDAHKKKKIVYYRVDLELVHIQSSEKVWIGSKKIKKFIKD